MAAGKKSVIFYFSFLLLTLSASLASAAEDWKVVKCEHFLVYYLDDAAFAEKTAEKAEKYYTSIADDLGYARYDQFWQWENRVKIYIYRTSEDFKIAAGIDKTWVGGMAHYGKKEIISYQWSEGFLESLLPHELTHLIFRDFVGVKGSIPLWLDEGVAMREEVARRKKAELFVRSLVRERATIPIADLTRMDIRIEKDAKIAWKFYAEAVTLVGYLIERYGGSRLPSFYRELRDGKNMDEALSFVYTGQIQDMNDLEKQWKEYYGR
jgi:hypothetical protein